MKKRLLIIQGAIAKVPLGVDAKDGYAIIDSSIADEVKKYNWCLETNGYAITRYKYKKIYLHRLIMINDIENRVVDHINRDRLDNRLSNLRYVTPRDNVLNKGMRIDNTSGYTGVYKVNNRWRAKVWHFGKQINLGYFDTLLEAVQARDNF